MSVSPYRTTQAHEDAVVSRLREIVAAVAEVEPGDVAADAMFYDDLLVDSLQKLEIVVRIERAFGVRLTDTEAAGMASVAGAAELLRAKGLSG
jgi:acyl carrier protein